MATTSWRLPLNAFGLLTGLCLASAGCQMESAYSLGNKKSVAATEGTPAETAKNAASTAVAQAKASTAETPTRPVTRSVKLISSAELQASAKSQASQPAPAPSASGLRVVVNKDAPAAGGQALPPPVPVAGVPASASGHPAPVPVQQPPTICELPPLYEGAPPRELQKTSHPPYMIEPPDILLIDSVRLVPKPPYRVEALDVLIIQAAETIPNQPIAGFYTVSPDGTVNLGFTYGSIHVAGLSLEQAELAIKTQLSRFIKNPQVAVVLGQFRGVQQTRGEHLVRADGTISLGTYGCVYVAGLTLSEAKCVIERHLSQFLLEPQLSLDVFAYNSKFYYVIADGGGYGQQIYKIPATGNETVLDAISNIGGLPVYSSKRKIWVARPAPPGHPCDQVLPVDWNAITQGGSTATNWQLFPGDRIYVKADCLIATNNFLTKFLAPIEQLFGVTLLGTSTVRNFGHTNNGNTIIP